MSATSRTGLWLLVGAVLAMLLVLGVAVGRRAHQEGQRPGLPWQERGKPRGERRHRLRRPRGLRARYVCRWRGHRVPVNRPTGWTDQVCRVCHQHVPAYGGEAE